MAIQYRSFKQANHNNSHNSSQTVAQDSFIQIRSSLMNATNYLSTYYGYPGEWHTFRLGGGYAREANPLPNEIKHVGEGLPSVGI